MKKKLVYDELFFKLNGLPINKCVKDEKNDLIYEEWNGSREVKFYI